MSARLGLSQRLIQALTGFSICARIAIGNAVIIVIVATAGIIVTRNQASFEEVRAPIAILIVAGSVLSIAASFFMTRLALQPLVSLRRLSEQTDLQSSAATPRIHLPNPDPDTCLVASTLEGLIRELETSNHQLKAIRSRSIGAQEEERKRIARGLHDDTGQALLSLILQLDRLILKTPEDQPDLKSQILEARQLAFHILNDLRKVIQDLRPAIMDDLGLVPAIRWYAHSTLEEAGIRSEIQSPEPMPELPPELSITLFRITQEAINNITHHAHAETASIAIRHERDKIYLRIEDNGRGFQQADNQEEAIRRCHWGLIGIRERLDRVGGELNLFSEPGQGTLMEVFIPLNGRQGSAG